MNIKALIAFFIGAFLLLAVYLYINRNDGFERTPVMGHTEMTPRLDVETETEHDTSPAVNSSAHDVVTGSSQ